MAEKSAAATIEELFLLLLDDEVIVPTRTTLPIRSSTMTKLTTLVHKRTAWAFGNLSLTAHSAQLSLFSLLSLLDTRYVERDRYGMTNDDRRR
jgi:hypothetical protein